MGEAALMPRSWPERDQEQSPFGVALERLCVGAPAIAAALVDEEGETVDYAGALSPFSVRVAAAEWQLVMAQCERSPRRSLGRVREILVRHESASFALCAIMDGYILVVQLPRGAFSLSSRALAQATREIASEAGLDNVFRAEDHTLWRRIVVREHQRRPLAIECGAQQWERVEILGRFYEAGLAPGERGYRVRLANGCETSLIREPLGRWYVDETWDRADGYTKHASQPPEPQNTEHPRPKKATNPQGIHGFGGKPGDI